MKLSNLRLSQRAFTLIELLVVIVVLGILVGVVIVVIDPNVQKEKAMEGVIKGNVDKIAQALIACVSTEVDPATQCNSLSEVGAIDPSGNPGGSIYGLQSVTQGGVTTMSVVGDYVRSNGTQCFLTISVSLSTYETGRFANGCHTLW